jgi:membrane protein YqaA with SNARE-associated domain
MGYVAEYVGGVVIWTAHQAFWVDLAKARQYPVESERAGSDEFDMMIELTASRRPQTQGMFGCVPDAEVLLAPGTAVIVTRVGFLSGRRVLCVQDVNLEGSEAVYTPRSAGVLSETAGALRAAAVAGSNATAMVNWGMALDSGEGVTQNKPEAVWWFRRAAESGNVTGMRNLGISLQAGDGVAANRSEAAGWFEKAAELGHARSMVDWALALEEGDGVRQDQAQAVAWYRKAAEGGSVVAMGSLGNCLRDGGPGVACDAAEAALWLRKAALAGNSGAMVNYGIALEEGDGVAENRMEATEWFAKAAEAGNAG